jgi:hypothetical protein
MRYNTEELLASLEKEVRHVIAKTKELQSLGNHILISQPQPDKWSVAQVFAHLNSYNRYYLTHIDAAIKKADKGAMAVFRPGWFGAYFTKMMYSNVKAGEISNKMKAPKDHRPMPQTDSNKAINEFLQGEAKLLELLSLARQYNISKVKVPISISRFIKLSLGDTFNFLIAHQVRHFLQIKNTLAAITSLSPKMQGAL